MGRISLAVVETAVLLIGGLFWLLGVGLLALWSLAVVWLVGSGFLFKIGPMGEFPGPNTIWAPEIGKTKPPRERKR